MANKTLKVTAPEELIAATIQAFAAMGVKEDEATSDEEHAIEMMLADFRAKIVTHHDTLRRQASREADRAATAAQNESIRSQRDRVTVTIE